MTVRTRMLVVCVVIAVGPLAAFAFLARRGVVRELVQQHQAQVAAEVRSIERSLQAQHEWLGQRLSALAGEIRNDNQLRALLTTGAPDRAYLLDYAERAMGLSGLMALRILDEANRIVSSGHYRNEFDRFDNGLVPLLAGANGPALVRFVAPDGDFVAQARVDSFSLGPARYRLVAATELPPLLPEEDNGSVTVALQLSPQPDTSAVVASIGLPLFDERPERAQPQPVTFDVLHDGRDLEELTGVLDRWLLLAAVASAIGAVIIAFWLAGVVTRPLTRLADQTRRVDWDRLDVGFATDRTDEVGLLSRMLAAMTERLRLDRSRLQEIERRATMGEVARQVNHDIKNGMVPIRNVVHHLAEVASEQPDQLAAVFRERASTLDTSLQYLENLSENYARLSPSAAITRVDVNAVLADVVGRMEARADVSVQTNLSPRTPVIQADPLMLRRIVANLVSNGMDAVTPPGTVSVSSTVENGAVRIIVEDDGRGMSREEFDRAFDDFFTTKDEGTGLGLSVVRRLVSDLNGSIRIESEPGAGTRAVVEFSA